MIYFKILFFYKELWKKHVFSHREQKKNRLCPKFATVGPNGFLKVTKAFTQHDDGQHL